MSRPVATVNVDVDPVDLHLVGYGHHRLAPDALVYSSALPRIADLFAMAGVRGTFFVVGRDAAQQAPALRALTEAGHEVASHSQSHPMSLSRMAPEALREELAGSRRDIGLAAGAEVLGFRAPNFDVNGRVLRALREAGYRYDASGYPTPWLIPARLVLAMNSGDPAGVLRLRMRPFTLDRRPHRLDGLVEFPLAVTRRLRFPIYHTARYWMRRDKFLRHLDDFARREAPLSYTLHAVDALGLAEDGVDARLGRHPGMARHLDEKLALLETTFADIAARFACVSVPRAARRPLTSLVHPQLFLPDHLGPEAASAARLVGIAGAHLDRLAASAQALRAVGRVSAAHADRQALGHVLGHAQEPRDRSKRPPQVVLVERGHDDPQAVVGHLFAHRDQIVVEELRLVERHDLGIRLQMVMDVGDALDAERTRACADRGRRCSRSRSGCLCRV